MVDCDTSYLRHIVITCLFLNSHLKTKLNCLAQLIASNSIKISTFANGQTVICLLN